jgi:hypothetical protein
MSHSQRVTEIFDQFKKSGIEGSTGNIRIELAGLSVELETKDIVGGAIQEWFENWLLSKKIKFNKPTNTQSFPDFLIEKKTFLEVKCFDSSRGPAFDIANYGSYVDSLLTIPERLDASYLIFSYSMFGTTLKIEEIWLKNIWEIAGPSPTNILEVQKKRGTPYNIRPKPWYAPTSRNFSSREEFVEALHLSALKFSSPPSHFEDWLLVVRELYLNKTGNAL